MTEMLLMVLRGVGEKAEAESVIVRIEDARVVFELDDGDRLTFDSVELRAAVRP